MVTVEHVETLTNFKWSKSILAEISQQALKYLFNNFLYLPRQMHHKFFRERVYEFSQQGDRPQVGLPGLDSQ
jgi:hypothetical protein